MRHALTLLTALPLIVLPAALAGPRDVNHVVNPGFEENADGKARGWSRYGAGYELVRGGRDGSWCIQCRSDAGGQTLGAAQEIVFDPPVQHPFLVSGWSKAAAVEGGEYCIYLDVHYADGTPLWGQIAGFRHGTHDWAYAESVFTPLKPVARIQTFVLFRRAKGTAWFDDIRVSLAPQSFTRTTVLGGFAGAGRIEAFALVSLPSTWQTQVRQGERVVFTQQGQGLSQRISWDGRDPAGQPVPPGVCTIRFAATDRLLGETVTWSRALDTAGVRPGRNYALWTESSMQRVMPADLPETADPPTTLAMSAARNEYESGQIVIMPPAGVTLRNVRAAVSDLAGPGGAHIAADNVQWHQVGYVWVEHQHARPDVPRYGPCWWPDPLLPVRSFDVDPGWAQPSPGGGQDGVEGLVEGRLLLARGAGLELEVGDVNGVAERAALVAADEGEQLLAVGESGEVLGLPLHHLAHQPVEVFPEVEALLLDGQGGLAEDEGEPSCGGCVVALAARRVEIPGVELAGGDACPAPLAVGGHHLVEFLGRVEEVGEDHVERGRGVRGVGGGRVRGKVRLVARGGGAEVAGEERAVGGEADQGGRGAEVLREIPLHGQRGRVAAAQSAAHREEFLHLLLRGPAGVGLHLQEQLLERVVGRGRGSHRQDACATGGRGLGRGRGGLLHLRLRLAAEGERGREEQKQGRMGTPGHRWVLPRWDEWDVWDLWDSALSVVAQASRL